MKLSGLFNIEKFLKAVRQEVSIFLESLFKDPAARCDFM